MTRDWSSIVLVALVLGGVFAAIGVKAVRERTIARIAARLAPYEQRLHDEAVIRQSLIDEAEYIVRDHHADIRHMFPDDDTTQWPDLCADKPCNWEDNYQCKAHRPPRGKHHVVHTITDLPEPSDPRWRQ